MNGSEGKVYKVKAFDKKVGEAFEEGEFVKNNLQKSKGPGSCTGGRGGGGQRECQSLKLVDTLPTGMIEDQNCGNHT